jgi:hypothetical protein
MNGYLRREEELPKFGQTDHSAAAAAVRNGKPRRAVMSLQSAAATEGLQRWLAWWQALSLATNGPQKARRPSPWGAGVPSKLQKSCRRLKPWTRTGNCRTRFMTCDAPVSRAPARFRLHPTFGKDFSANCVVPTTEVLNLRISSLQALERFAKFLEQGEWSIYARVGGASIAVLPAVTTSP